MKFMHLFGLILLVSTRAAALKIHHYEPEAYSIQVDLYDDEDFLIGAEDPYGLYCCDWYVDNEDQVRHYFTQQYYDEDSWSYDFDEPGEFTISAYVYNTSGDEEFTYWIVDVEDHEPDINREYPGSKYVTITQGETITFEVSATDEDGDLDFFEWYVGSSFKAHHSASGSYEEDDWSWTFNTTGVFEITSYIYDEWDNQDDVVWFVTVEPPHPPEIDRNYPAKYTNAQLGDTIEFSVDVSDEDGDLDFVEWYEGTTHLISHNVSGYSDTDTFSRTFNSPGTVGISSYVYDELDQSDYLWWEITVQEPVPPEIQRNYPGVYVTVPYGSELEFSVDVTDENGDLDFVEWYQGSTHLISNDVSGSSDTSTFSMVFTDPGTVGISCYVYDELDQSAFVWWEVTVEPPPPPEIQRNHPDSLVFIELGDALEFSVDLSDENGDLDFVEWYEGSTFLDNHDVSGYEDTDTFSRTFQNSGSFDISAYVYDAMEQQDFTLWTVTVADPLPPEIQRLFPDSIVTVQLGEPFQLGVSVTDANGDLFFVEWYQESSFLENHPISGYSDTDTLNCTLNSYVCTHFYSYAYDDQLNQDMVWWYVIVEEPVAPEIQRISPESTLTVPLGTEIEFSTALSDSNGDLNFTEWYNASTFLENHSISGYEDTDSFSWVFSDYGETLISSYVYDDENQEDFTWWQITVQTPSSPEVEFIAPDSSVCETGETVEFVVSITDEDEDLEFIEWYAGSEYIATDTIAGGSAADTLLYEFTESGNAEISAYVYDELGNEGYDFILMTVVDPALPPVIDSLYALPDTTVFTNQQVTCFGSVSDSDADLDLLEWYSGNTLERSVDVSGGSAADSVVFVFDSPGAYPISFYAYDLQENSTFGTLTIHASPPPDEPPVAVRVSPDSVCSMYPCEEIQFIAQFSDVNGDMDLIQWYDGEMNLIKSTPVYGNSWTDSLLFYSESIGNSEITCIAHDQAGNEAELCWILTVTVPPEETVFFDDFVYDSPGQMIGSVCHWILFDGPGEPGLGNWDMDLLSLIPNPAVIGDKILLLESFTRGDPNSTWKSGLNTAEAFALTGTYAARAMFFDQPVYGRPIDNVVQAFYTYPHVPDTSLLFSEMDFEYLTQCWRRGNPLNQDPQLQMVTWEIAEPRINKPDSLMGSLNGEWKNLLISLNSDAETVDYYVNAVCEASHDVYYPESPMNISLSNWYSWLDASAFMAESRYRYQVDYVFYCENEELSQATVNAIVEAYRDQGINRLNGFSANRSAGISPSAESHFADYAGILQPFSMSVTPNPASSSVTVRFISPGAQPADVRVFSIDGRCVEQLLEGEVSPGMHAVNWNTSSTPSGMYYIRVNCGNETSIEKCLIISN